jgi:hypothetical protein
MRMDLTVQAFEQDTGATIPLVLDYTDRFTSPPLPPGRWVVRARGASAERRWEGPAVEAAWDREIEVLLRQTR